MGTEVHGMSDKYEIELVDRIQAWKDIQDGLYPFLKGRLNGETKWILTLSTKKRTSPQNRRYWGRGVLSQISEQAKVGGQQYGAEAWHELAKRKFLGVTELPDGSIVGKSSTNLTTTEFSDFCTQVEAWAATELGVTFYDLPT
jgi:hypothetical protein